MLVYSISHITLENMIFIKQNHTVQRRSLCRTVFSILDPTSLTGFSTITACSRGDFLPSYVFLFENLPHPVGKMGHT